MDQDTQRQDVGAIIWLTGLSGSGKTTISGALERELIERNIRCYLLDGDSLRRGLNSNLGFSPEDRAENIRRIAEVARLMADAGLIAIVACISPYVSDRRRARAIGIEGGIEFIEVFVDAPLAVCEQRDPKGLYKKARAGEIAEFTGISAPYEAPADAECVLHTDRESSAESVARLMRYLQSRIKQAR